MHLRLKLMSLYFIEFSLFHDLFKFFIYLISRFLFVTVFAFNSWFTCVFKHFSRLFGRGGISWESTVVDFVPLIVNLGLVYNLISISLLRLRFLHWLLKHRQWTLLNRVGWISTIKMTKILLAYGLLDLRYGEIGDL